MTVTRLAVVDMGSNSFHLLIADVENGHWRPRFTAERKVQLAANRRGVQLCAQAQARALQCLTGYLEVMAAHQCRELRIVATASLRGTDCAAFLQQVHGLCGVVPQVISGEDEAALVYLGVSQGFAEQQQYLVVDVGGGSTEVALGQGRRLLQFRSVPVGCLSYLRHFPDEQLSAASFEAAYREAAGVFGALSSHLGSAAGRITVGSSGSLLAVEAVLRHLGRSDSGIDAAALAWLAQDLSRFGNLGELRYGGLSEDRRSVFASGVAIVKALFDRFSIRHMALSDSGLREGVMARWVAHASGGEQVLPHIPAG